MIAIASDHGGFELKQQMLTHLDLTGVPYKDFGTYSADSVDYPDFVEPACKAVLAKEADYAILVCGTGIGVSIASNKMRGIRAALCGDCFSARYTRLHNNANVLCLGGRVVGPGLAAEIIDVFLSTSFEGGRHQLRLDKITKLEESAER